MGESNDFSRTWIFSASMACARFEVKTAMQWLKSTDLASVV
jgi:hypothetical protein